MATHIFCVKTDKSYDCLCLFFIWSGQDNDIIVSQCKDHLASSSQIFGPLWSLAACHHLHTLYGGLQHQKYFFSSNIGGRSPPTINLKRSHYKKVSGIPGRELHEREFGDRVYRRGNLKTELQIGLATFATHRYMAGFSCICPSNC